MTEQVVVRQAKCAVCGRFISYAQMGEGGKATFYFEPDSHFGPEICEWTCAKCADAETARSDHGSGTQT